MTGAHELELGLEHQPSGAVVLRVSGEADLATVSELESALAEVIPPDPLVVDLSDCGFVDSSAVRVLLAAASKAAEAGGAFSIVAPGGGVRRTLEIAGVGAAVPVHGTVAEALLEPSS